MSDEAKTPEQALADLAQPPTQLRPKRMKMYRCYNPRCADRPEIMPGFDFMAETPTCPKCGTSQEHKNPRLAGLIVNRVTIHFDPPHPAVDNVGLNTLACDPSKAVGRYQASGDPDAVTCPACRLTEAWHQANTAKSFDPADDVPLEINVAAGAIALKRS